jgi:hypothetical protein
MASDPARLDQGTQEVSGCLVEIEDGNQYVRVRTRNGKLLIDVNEPGETVHVACPLAMIEDVSRQLEAQAPGV